MFKDRPLFGPAHNHSHVKHAQRALMAAVGRSSVNLICCSVNKLTRPYCRYYAQRPPPTKASAGKIARCDLWTLYQTDVWSLLLNVQWCIDYNTANKKIFPLVTCKSTVVKNKNSFRSVSTHANCTAWMHSPAHSLGVDTDTTL